MSRALSGPALVVLAALTAWTAGCTRGPEEPRPEALEEALAGTRVARDGAVVASEPPPFAGAEPHRIRMEATFELEGGREGGTSLTLTRTVDRGPGGAFRLEERRTWVHPVEAPEGVEDGREAVCDGERFAVRRLWAPWMLRETLGGRAQRFLRSLYDVLPEALAGFGPYIRWTPVDAGAEAVAGLPVAWQEAALDPAVRPRAMDEETLVGLRDHEQHWTAWLAATHRPTKLRGRVARRAEGEGEVLAGHLDVSGSATVEGRESGFRLRVRWDVEDLPRDAAFAVPEDALPARRDRPWRMIRDVLGDALDPAYAP